MPRGKRKLNPEDVELAAGTGCTLTEAAAVLGVTINELLEALRQPKLLAAWDGGRAKTDYKVAEALLQNALAGNVDAQKFWLTNRRPDQWKSRPTIPKPVDRPAEARATAVEPPRRGPLDGVRLRLPKPD